MVTSTPSQEKPAATEIFKPQNFERLLGTPGFSDTLLRNHFKLYEGYVKQTNALTQLRTDLVKQGRADSPEFAETTRRLGWEFNGVRLHELYFSNMGGDGKQETAQPLVKEITDQFGTWDAWKNEFLGVAAMRGIGWAILYRDPVVGRLFNVWIEEHHTGHFAGCTPLLVLDVFEHAWMPDYGLERQKYLDAFMKTVNWNAVAGRRGDSAAS